VAIAPGPETRIRCRVCAGKRGFRGPSKSFGIEKSDPADIGVRNSARRLCYDFATKQASQRWRLFSFTHYSQGGNRVWIQLFADYGTLFKIP
jgi:hypothetical protein